jgi:hypothetical protein
VGFFFSASSAYLRQHDDNGVVLNDELHIQVAATGTPHVALVSSKCFDLFVAQTVNVFLREVVDFFCDDWLQCCNATAVVAELH